MGVKAANFLARHKRRSQAMKIEIELDMTPEEARRIRRRLELHYTPVHGSWLNMAELEFSLLARQCLDRRIGDATRWSPRSPLGDRANEQRATISWQFNVDDARRKLHRLYPT